MMKEGAVSLSARVVASSRAAESEVDAASRVCNDPFARCFLGGRLYLIGNMRAPKPVGLWLQRRVVPGFHDYFVARTRYIDDAVAAAVSDGVGQVVILGAGYDSRAYRLAALQRIKVFEVDQPATQEEKLLRVQECVGQQPDNVTLVPVDLNTDTLANALSINAYDSNARTLFVWEGVTPYLDSAAVDETLAFIRRSSGPTSLAVFDYLDKDVLLGRSRDRMLLRWVSRTRGTGEPVRFGIEPSDVETFLTERGLKLISHARSADLDEKYFKPFKGRRWATPAFAIVQAQVP